MDPVDELSLDIAGNFERSQHSAFPRVIGALTALGRRLKHDRYQQVVRDGASRREDRGAQSRVPGAITATELKF
jgi:hypothetical protein